MKYANFSLVLGFAFLNICTTNLYASFEHAQACAKILLFADKEQVLENERMQYCCEMIATNLYKNLLPSELEEYEEHLSTPEMQKFLHLLSNWCGGPYNLFYAIVEKMRDNQQQYKMSIDALSLRYHEICIQERDEKPSEDFYEQIFEWVFDFGQMQDLLLLRHSECFYEYFSNLFDSREWDETSLLLFASHAKVELAHFYFIRLILFELQKEAKNSFKQNLEDSDFSAHDIIKIHKFMYSPLGKKAHDIHIDCVERLGEELLQHVNF